MVKNKRSFFAVILTFVMMLTLVACGTSNNNNSESARKSETEFTEKAKRNLPEKQLWFIIPAPAIRRELQILLQTN